MSTHTAHEARHGSAEVRAKVAARLRSIEGHIRGVSRMPDRKLQNSGFIARFGAPDPVNVLFILKIDKNLSFGERKMMDTAKNLLVKEISIASKSEEKKVEQDLQTIFTVQ